MGAVKNTVKDHNTYIGIAIGFFIVPMLMGRYGSKNVKVPSA